MFEEQILPNWILPIAKPKLARIMKQVKPYTMVSRKRMQNLWRLLQRVEREGVEGDFVELGVARGGTAAMIATVARGSRIERYVWLYDAFENLSSPCATYSEVWQTMFSTFHFNIEKVHLVSGFFADVVPARPSRPISFLHIDASGAEAVRDALYPLFPLVTPHGWIVFDNYGADSGCRTVVDGFLMEHGLTQRLCRFGRSQAFFQKP